MADNLESQKTVYHIETGAVRMYPVDAANAVAQHPGEWSVTPWSPEDASTARKARHDEQVAIAKQQGVEPPPPPVEPVISDEDKKMLSDDAKIRREALDRVTKYEADKKEADDRDAQYKQDKLLLNSPSPTVDVTQRRPFGRPGEMTPAERANAQRRAAEQAKKKNEGSAEDEADVNARTAAKENADSLNKRTR